MHQSFFSMPIQEIINAAQNNQLEGVPFLSKPDLIQKYLPPLPVTPKGRVKRLGTGMRSARKKKGREKEVAQMRAAANENTTTATNFIPLDEDETNNIFCFAALADKQTGTMYTNQIGALPHVC